MMLDKLKDRLKDEDYNLSFEEFIKRLNIEEDFKRYEDAYVTSVASTFGLYVKSPRMSEYAEKEFKNKELVKEAKSNLRNYIISVVNSSMLWGYNGAYNLVPDISLPIAKMIASCFAEMDVYPEIRNKCETGRVVSIISAILSSEVGNYERYIKTLDREMSNWFVHYLSNHTITCIDGQILGSDDGKWENFIECVSHILTHIAIYKVLHRDYFVMNMHSIYEVASLRFILQELKDVLDIRVFYDGCDSFPKELYQSIFDDNYNSIFEDNYNFVVFGDTYADCYTKSALNDIWNDVLDYDTITLAVYSDSDFISLTKGNYDYDYNMQLMSRINLIDDAVYNRDSYMIVNKGTESEKNIDQIIKSNPEYSAFYSVEL